jgi:hypothetical protein
MLGRLLSHLASFVALVLFILVLPFLLGLLLIPTLPEDDRFFLKAAFTFLGPFSAVFCYIGVSRLVFHRRAGYLMQAVVFFGTIGVIYLLLANGVYHL